MAGHNPRGGRKPRHLTEPRAVRWALIGVALAFVGLFLIVPLVAVFSEALAKGFGAYASDAVCHSAT